MIEFKHLAHIGIRVADFPRSVRFYRQFDFEVTREDYKEHVVVLRHASGLELNFLDSSNNPNGGRNVLMDEAMRYSGYTHIAFRVDDVRYAVEQLEEQHIVITEGPVTFGDGSTSVFFRDPDLNVIELSESPAEEEEVIFPHLNLGQSFFPR